MSNLRRIVVLGVTTWAFVVCFAVWVMFGVVGIPIKKRTWSQRHRIWPVDLDPCADWRVVSPAAWYLDRQIRRPDRDVPAAGRLRRTGLVLQPCQPALAIPLAWFGAWLGRRLFCRRHALCRAPLYEGAARFRDGGVRRRHKRCGDQHVRRSSSDGPLWLAVCSKILCRCAFGHCANFLVPFGTRCIGTWQERRSAAAAIGSVQGPAGLEVLPVLLNCFRRLYRLVGMDATILREGVRAERCGSLAAGRMFLAPSRCVACNRRLARGSLWRTQRDVVGLVGGVD